jgi:metal-dependent hydrolase (beta-lactamase superfamily II)
MANLAAAGVDPKSIDVVLITHLHPDHTNGIRAADGSMAFPTRKSSCRRRIGRSV